MNKKIVSIVSFLLILTLSFQTFVFSQGNQNIDTTNEETPSVQKVSFLATGDNLIHGAIYVQALQRGNGTTYDFDYLYENIAPFLQGYDIRYINQETLINSVYEPSTYPMFSSPPELGVTLYGLGFRVFSISNNHTYDKGAGGVAATLDYWQSMPDDIYLTGLYTDEANYFNFPIYRINGITFAFFAYTEHTNGLPTPHNANAHVIYVADEETLEKQIRFANLLVDVVVVIPHWGIEGTHVVSEAQRTLAEKMNGWGTDIILGSHPHVLQEIEWIVNEESSEKTLVIYSLGNFVSAQSAPDNLIGGFFTFDVIKTNGMVTIENPSLYPVITHYGYNYSNITAYLYTDYNQELAALHGIRSDYPSFSYAYIKSVLENTISDEFLILA